MATFARAEDGTWSVEFDETDPQENRNQVYDDAVLRYLNAFDPAYTKASAECESEFVKALLRVSSMQDAGWDPYETTLRAVPAMEKLHDLIPEGDEHYETSRHLALWTYGHIIEASEPYAILGDMLHIAGGGWFKAPQRFPDVPLGRARKGELPWQVPHRPQRFDEKLPELERLADEIGEPGVIAPLGEVWDRDLRNAVFHADYVIHGSETRVPAKGRSYTHDQIQTLVNRALAYHFALSLLHRANVRAYMEPVAVRVHPDVATTANEEMVVMVREGHGAVGIRYVYTAEEVAAGAIAAWIARLYPDEAAAVQADPTLVLLPSRQG